MNANPKTATMVAVLTAIGGILSSVYQLAQLRHQESKSDALILSVMNAHTVQIDALKQEIETLRAQAHESSLEISAVSEFAHDTRLSCDDDYANRYGDKSDIGWRKENVLKMVAPVQFKAVSEPAEPAPAAEPEPVKPVAPEPPPNFDKLRASAAEGKVWTPAGWKATAEAF